MKKIFLLFMLMSLLTCNLFDNSVNNNDDHVINGNARYNNMESHESINVSLEKNGSIIQILEVGINGDYSFSNLDAGSYNIIASSINSKEKQVSTTLEINSIREVSADDLNLTAIGKISGEITVDYTSNDTLGFMVMIAGTSFMAVTDQYGSFVISDVPVGSNYFVIISKGNYLTEWTTTNIEIGKISALGSFNINSSELNNIQEVESLYELWLSLGNIGTKEDFLNSLKGDNGLSAYEIWLNLGNEGTELDFISSLQGTNGENGLSAYEIWLELGNEGTEIEFLNSLQGSNGMDGLSAYEIWINLGNEGSELDFINSLQGIDGVDGLSAYEIWINLGNEGTELDFINSLQGTNGENGLSAYEIWLELGNEGTELDFLNSLQGSNGIDGLSAYDIWINLGNEGSELDFINSLQGIDGVDGLSAYDIWINLGNDGTELDFISSLHGSVGVDGLSAYEIWINLGNEGTELEFISSLQGIGGENGLSAYDIWLKLGNNGSEQEFISSLTGPMGSEGEDGLSAYEIWINLGNVGSETDFINSLQGTNGDDGQSAYDIWLSLGNEGTEEDFIDSLSEDIISANRLYTELVSIPGGMVNIFNKVENTLSDYMLGKYEVTYDLWWYVYNWAIQNGYEFIFRGREGSSGGYGTEPSTTYRYHPVGSISYNDTLVWLNAYSEVSGFATVYKDLDGNTFKDASLIEKDNIIVEWNNDGFRLPTYSEWFYAAINRDNDYPYDYAGSSDVNNVAWYRDNSSVISHQVGEKQPNELGIYDLNGNIGEICFDNKVYAQDMETGAFNNYTFQNETDEYFFCGSSYAHLYSNNYQNFGIDRGTVSINVGFRVARRSNYYVDVNFLNFDNSILLNTTNIVGKLLYEPELPEYEDHVFFGWYKDEELTTSWNFEVDRTYYNVTLYPKWKFLPSYTITFHSNGGDTVESQTIHEGFKITKPSEPYKEGYEFMGWYLDPEMNTLWDFEIDEVQSNIDLYARWESLRYSVSLILTEFSINLYNQLRWIELYNKSDSVVNLKDYELIISGDSDNVSINPLPDREILPNEYCVIRDGGMYDDVIGRYNTYLTGQQLNKLIWDDSGSIELLYNNQTIDFVRFGTCIDVSETPGNWQGESCPSPVVINTYCYNSLTRDSDNSDSNSANDWTYSEWSTPGGPNDVIAYIDEDKDGIPDANELPGTTYLGMPLYEWGARQGIRDFFVHIAYMVNPTISDSPGIIPRPEALEKIQEAFKNQKSSLLNYAVHFDVGDTSNYSSWIHSNLENYNLDNKDHSLPYYSTIGWSNSFSGEVDFFELKANYLPMNKRQIFHFLVMGSHINGAAGIGELSGNDFLVATAESVNPFVSEESRIYLVNRQSDVIMHELGHNLGLHHGGNEAENYKPNYISVMNYMYTGHPEIGHSFEGDRFYYYMHGKVFSYNQSNVYASNYYESSFYGSSLHNNIYSETYKLDYSNGSSIDINEFDIDESKGLGREGSAHVDFNGDLSIDSSISMDLNPTDVNNGDEILTDHNDWEDLYSIFNRNSVGIIRSSLDDKDNNSIFDPIFNDRQELTVETFIYPPPPSELF